MAIFSHYVITWMVVMMALKVEIVKGKGDFTKNTKSVFSLEERNLLALGKIFETLQKLAEPTAKCDSEDETNAKLLSLVSAVETTQNSTKIIAESIKKSTEDTSAKFETLLTEIRNTQKRVKVFATAIADGITTPASSNTDLCESPYFLVGDECFSVSSNAKDWESAKIQCQSDGGSLAAPKNLDLLRQHLRYTGDVADYWIGGHGNDGSWKWITGDPIADEWQEHQPSGQPGQDCLDFRAGHWPSLNDYNCHETQRYICERPFTGTVPPTPEPVDCGSVSAIQAGQKCISISEDKLNWQDAATACTDKGGKLASLHNQTDIQKLHDYLDTNYELISGEKIFWLGGSDSANEGDWVWMDGQPIKNFPWRYPEPNGGRNENCLDWGHARHFNDAPCHRRWRYICEYEINGEATTVPPRISTVNIDSVNGLQGPFANIFTMEQCNSIDYEEGMGMSLVQCVAWCEANLVCTAFNYHEIKQGGSCVRRACPVPVPQPLGIHIDSTWKGYILIRETNGVTTTAQSTVTVNTDVCKPPYFLIGEECFRISDDKKDWDSANVECHSEGGSLAVPEDLDLLRQHLIDSGEAIDYWIGAHDKDGTWKWITGDPVEDNQWMYDQPSGSPGEDCLDFRAGRSPSLNDYLCYKTQKYLCERPLTGAALPTQEPGPLTGAALPTQEPETTNGVATTAQSTVTVIVNTDLCEPPYFLIGEECFRISGDTKDWDSANLVCQSEGGSLAAPENLGLLRQHLIDSGVAADYWIGGNDRDGTWKWITGDPVEEDQWRLEVPPESTGQGCLDFQSASWPSLNVYFCSMRQSYLCERPLTGTALPTQETDLTSSESQTTENGTTVQESAT